jgi:ABC-2 type transport system permease protein
MKPYVAQLRAEVVMTLRRGESLLLALGIPVLLLVFFSLVNVLPVDVAPGEKRAQFLAPGILALAVMSSAMVGLAIATAFERQYGVLKRIGTTPLGRPRLLAAKISATVAVEIIQLFVIVLVGFALGWRPTIGGIGLAVIAVLLGTAAFAGLGLAMAGTMRAEAVLAGANGLYMVLLLISGMVFSLAKLPSGLRTISRWLPSTALADVMRGVLTNHGSVRSSAWVILALWAVAAPMVAARTFRWE